MHLRSTNSVLYGSELGRESMSESIVANQPVVIDNVSSLLVIKCIGNSPSSEICLNQGSGVLKAGFAGADHPKVTFPALYPFCMMNFGFVRFAFVRARCTCGVRN